MHAVIRTYSGSGAKDLFDVLEQRKSDVESLMRSVKGFGSYLLIRTGDGGISVTVCQDKVGTGDGGISVTVCQDKVGTDDSVRKAKDWIGKNASNIGANAPRVSEGLVIFQVG